MSWQKRKALKERTGSLGKQITGEKVLPDLRKT
jgi:hypothetical protein